MVGSSVDSQSSSGPKLDFGLGYIIYFGLITDSHLATGIDFVSAKRFQFPILRLTMGSSP